MNKLLISTACTAIATAVALFVMGSGFDSRIKTLEIETIKSDNEILTNLNKVAEEVVNIKEGKNQAGVIADTVWKVNQNCSSVLLSKTRALTASHCIQTAKTGILSREESENKLDQLSYKVIKDDIPNDLALLEVNADEGAETAEIAEALCVKPGDDVYLSGYPAAVTLELTRGLYSGLVMINNRVLIKATPPGYPGNSGGPLYQVCNGKYEIIGIVSQGYREQGVPVTHMLVYNPLDKIKEFLNGSL